ncbi:MAG: FGGY-family carbohydrate kinase, partial [Candidatus Roizmanbacteria bacterium]
ATKAINAAGSKNNFLMQFQSDLLDIPVERPKVIESTALGAAYLAGLAVGFWKDKEDIKKNRRVEKTFTPSKNREKFEGYYLGWKKAVDRVLDPRSSRG